MSDQVNRGYAAGQVARALVTAISHEEGATRERAADRVRRWQMVLDGMASGLLDIGSRTPVKGLPAWVTPQVVRGGFATGEPAAGGPLKPDEVERARRLGLPAQRSALFESWLTAEGLAELDDLLDSGHYRIECAEEAVLPVVAWLLRGGENERAVALLDQISPYADRLRFAPAPSERVVESPDVVYRATAGEVRPLVERRRLNDRVEAQREALAIWNPFADELLAFWTADRAVCAVLPTQAAPENVEEDRARHLLDRYRTLAAEHPRCGKHRNPKSNIGVLRSALEKRVAGEDLTPREVGLVRSVVAAMLRKRGELGGGQHRALRQAQARDAAQPSHHEIAQLVAVRLGELPQNTGITDVDAAVAPVGDSWVVPKPVVRLVLRAAAGTPEQLIARGVVGSAEVLAQLTPRIAAVTAASAYADPALHTLMDATHRAFSNRRSLLLLDLQHQVRIHELPWVRAVHSAKLNTTDTRVNAWKTMVRLAAVAIGGFPGTILPNPLIREIMKLSKQAERDLPWTEELAADIFMGRFSPKFLDAAQLAARTLDGSLYGRYYDIDYNDMPSSGAEFDRLCLDRAGYQGKWKWGRVAAAGMVIEQAQIITTHNLATALYAGVDRPWEELARRAFDNVLRLTARLHGNPRPLGTIKNAAYAWRQMLVFLSLSESPFIEYALQRLSEQSSNVRKRLDPAMIGLMAVMDGGRVTDGGGQRFLGWTTARHWMLDLGDDRGDRSAGTQG